jgi:tRNA dimethylallyltransferase
MQTLITIIGPTATGKSDLAVAVALHIEETFGKKAEIISADSRQIYKHLDIGTGKITEDEMCGIPHHMLDIIDPKDLYSVFRYADDVNKILHDMQTRNVVPILCGGTGFYIDAVLFGNVGAETPPDLERQNELEILDMRELTVMLQKLSEEKNIDISHVDIQNKRRVARAITILQSDGTFAKKNTEPLYNTLCIGLDTTTEKLRERIQKRISVRMDQGMIEESEKLLEEGIFTHDRMKKLGLEYKFISQLITKEITLGEFTEKLFFAIWHYAKRQRVWFKRYTQTHWFDAEDIKQNSTPVYAVVDEFFKVN